VNNFAYLLLYLFTNVIHLLLTVELSLMFLRAILSWFPLSQGNPVESFLIAVTEPFIIPVRMIIDRFDSLSSLPIDISFFISFIGLSIITEMLSFFKV